MPVTYRKQTPSYVFTARFIRALHGSILTHTQLAASIGSTANRFSLAFHGAMFGPRLKVKYEQIAAQFEIPADKAFRRVR